MLKIILKFFKEFLRIILGKRRIRQSYNLLKYRLSSKSEALTYKPIYLTILPIHRCNLSCKMCLTHSKEILDNEFRHKYFNDMSFETFKDIIERFDEALAVGFMGNGEPLLNKDIFKMIDYAETKGKMRTSMITNGIILSDFAQKILSSRLNEICISINGHNQEEFSRMTGMSKEHFRTIIDSSTKFIKERNRVKSKLKIVASIIVDKINVQYLQEMIDFADRLMFDTVSFYNILPLTKERAKQLSIYDDPQTLKILNNIKLPSSGMKVIFPIPLEDGRKNNICEDFFTSINIDGAGNVGGCNRQRFNIDKSGKYHDKDVWNNNYFKSERRKFLEGDFELDEPCTVCYANSIYVNISTKSTLIDT